MMKLVVASDQVRDNLFVEVHHNGTPWAEVIYDDRRGVYLLTTFEGVDGKWPEVELSEALRMLEAARRELVSRGFPDVA